MGGDGHTHHCVLMYGPNEASSEPSGYRKLWLFVILGSVLFTALVLVAINGDSLLVAYHAYRLRSLVENDDGLGEAYDYHQMKLVDYGVLVRRRFDFDHVYRSTPKSNTVRMAASELLWSDSDNPYGMVSFSYPMVDEHTKYYFVVVDIPENIGKWQTFVAAHDVTSLSNETKSN